MHPRAEGATPPSRPSTQSPALGEHKPGRIKPGRIKRASLSLQNQNHYIVVFRYDPVYMPLTAPLRGAWTPRMLLRLGKGAETAGRDDRSEGGLATISTTYNSEFQSKAAITTCLTHIRRRSLIGWANDKLNKLHANASLEHSHNNMFKNLYIYIYI